MKEIFYPNSVAVIGVSDSPKNLGRGIVHNLIEFDFQGIIYEVGQRGGIFAGRRIYRSVLDIPDHVDLAVVLTPAHTVPEMLDECGQKGIRWAVVETAGFREYGSDGIVIEAEILRVAEKWGIRFSGPNCIGLINMENGLSLPFTALRKEVRLGDISIISQSGGVGISMLNLMSNEGLGLNKFISVGNMLNVQMDELLEYFIDDPGTKYIFLYMEGIKNGRKLMEAARRSPKPIVALKANIGEFGKHIASSHTASLSSNDRVVDAAFRQCGIHRVDDITSLGNDLKVLRLPPMRGKNIAVVSRSGGHAVIAADACETSGLNLVQFTDDFLAEIESHFRASVIKLTNPLDLGDLFDMEIYAKIVDRTLAQEQVDGIVFLHTFFAATEGEASLELFDRIIELSKKYDKPVALYVSTEDKQLNELKKNLRYPVFTQIVETVRALELNRWYYMEKERLQEPRELVSFETKSEEARAVIERAIVENRDLLLHEATEILDQYGIPVARGIPVHNEQEAIRAASELGYPVAMKIISKQISHKSDFGGVQLNLRTDEGVADAYRDMTQRISTVYPDKQIDGALIQHMITGGRELIVGGMQDDQFGPVVLVGLGGIFVEIFGEISVRVAPISKQDAIDMINELRGLAILKGARGTLPSDLEAVADVLLRISQMLTELPEIKEIDINPLRVFSENEGCTAIDVRIITPWKK